LLDLPTVTFYGQQLQNCCLTCGGKSSLNSLKQDGSMSGREEKVAKKDHSGYGGDEKRSSASASI